MDIRMIAPLGLLLCMLGGCAMSSGMVALSYTANGISYASSGKGVADHALSAAASRDCAMLRAVQGEDICAREDRAKDETLMTMIDAAVVTRGDDVRESAKAVSDRFKMASDRWARPAPAKADTPAMSALESIYSLGP
jgi:hypothetical protein